MLLRKMKEREREKWNGTIGKCVGKCFARPFKTMDSIKKLHIGFLLIHGNCQQHHRKPWADGKKCAHQKRTNNSVESVSIFIFNFSFLCFVEF